VAAKCQKEILAPLGYPGTCDSQLFNFWIENILVNQLKQGQTVIMDNARIHKNEKTKKLIENAGCNLVFLPPYSPDLNPIENFWGTLKKNIRSSIRQFNSLTDAIQHPIA
jgi:transposase